MPRRPEGETRSLILANAERLFLRNGFSGTSVRDIATSCAVSVPALYHYFPSKDALVSAWCEPFALDSERMLETLDGLSESAIDRPAFERLALEHYFDVLSRHERVFRVVSIDRGLRSHPLAGQRLAELAARFRALLAGSDGEDDVMRAVAAIGALRMVVRFASSGTLTHHNLRPMALASAHAALSAPAPD